MIVKLPSKKAVLSQIIIPNATSVNPLVHTKLVHLSTFCTADLLQASETLGGF